MYICRKKRKAKFVMKATYIYVLLIVGVIYVQGQTHIKRVISLNTCEVVDWYTEPRYLEPQVQQEEPPNFDPYVCKDYSILSYLVQLDTLFLKRLEDAFLTTNISYIGYEGETLRKTTMRKNYSFSFKKLDSSYYEIIVEISEHPDDSTVYFYEGNGRSYWLKGTVPNDIIISVSTKKKRFTYTKCFYIYGDYSLIPIWKLLYNTTNHTFDKVESTEWLM